MRFVIFLQVHTSVRSAAKAEFLKSLNGAPERLTIFSGVDLLESGSYNECITGCDAVLHTASPFFFEGGEDSLVTPALEGDMCFYGDFRICNVS